MVLLDDYAVMHSRKPWEEKRVVLAGLWDEGGRTGGLGRQKGASKARADAGLCVKGSVPHNIYGDCCSLSTHKPLTTRIDFKEAEGGEVIQFLWDDG